jgi:hypothetical protein
MSRCSLLQKRTRMSNEYESAAILTIKNAAEMSKRGRKSIATWLRHAADDLEELGSQYSGSFRARYLYPRQSPTS